MHKRIWILMLLLATLAFAGIAHADTYQIIIAGGSSTMTFTGTGTGATAVLGGVSTGGGALFDNTTFSSQSGTYTLSPGGPITLTATPNGSSYTYAVAPGATLGFSYTLNSDVISGTITLTQFSTNNTPGSTQANFSGSFTPSSGTGQFAAWAVAGTTTSVNLSLTTTSGGNPYSVDSIVGSNGGTTAGPPTSGHVDAIVGNPPSSVPEPASIAMIGSGLVALGGFIRRRFGK